MEVSLEQWIILAGVIGPFFTAFAAKINTPDWWKGLISICFAAAVSVVNQWLSTDSFDLAVATSDAFAVWATHLITWLGVSSTAVDRFHHATSRFGLGSPGSS